MTHNRMQTMKIFSKGLPFVIRLLSSSSSSSFFLSVSSSAGRETQEFQDLGKGEILTVIYETNVYPDASFLLHTSRFINTF
jgi:hypothetical protein